MNPKNITACVRGGSRSIELARILGREFKKVYFAPIWESDFPKKNIALIGKGMKEFEVVDSPYTNKEVTDLFVYPDIYSGDEQISLEREGHLVWGSRNGDELETDRVKTKIMMEKMGLPVGPYEVVHGIDELRKFLEDNENQWLKTSKYRGHLESTFIKNYRIAKTFIDALEYDLGINARDQEFILDADLPDCFEIALDGYRIDGLHTSTILYGIERKDTMYVGKFEDYDKIPKQIREFDEAITGYLKKNHYRNFFSAEKRINRKKQAFMIDACCRQPSPPGEAELFAIKNIPEIILEGSDGKIIEPQPKGKFVVELMMKSEWAGKHDVMVEFPKEFRENLKLWNCIIKDDECHIMPQLMEVDTIGGLCATGATKKEAFENAKDIAKEVRCFDLKIDEDSFDKVCEAIEEAKEFGFDILGE